MTYLDPAHELARWQQCTAGQAEIVVTALGFSIDDLEALLIKREGVRFLRAHGLALAGLIERLQKVRAEVTRGDVGAAA